jgi:hypothetical protein
MNSASIARVPHVHAEVIKAWADGAQIEYRTHLTPKWTPITDPIFNVGYEYRVKPEPPAKVYPVTQMRDEDLSSAWSVVPAGYNGLRGFVNAALRHAIDAGQIITIADHQTELFTLGDRLRDIEIARHADRDMAIAKAVRDYITDGWPKSNHRYFPTYCESVDLATIITKVRP